MVRFITANRLDDGQVVYLTRDHAWSTRSGDATLLDGEQATQLLAWARGDEGRVCNPYVVECSTRPDGSLALPARERLRSAGPEAVMTRLRISKEA